MNPSVIALSMPGTYEMIVILVIALLVFGRKLPDVARSVGKSIVEFKKGMREVTNDIDERSRIESDYAKKRESTPSASTEKKSEAGESH